MLTITYLIKFRERPKNARRLLKLIVKRTLLTPRLIHLVFRPMVLKFKGANIGAMSTIGAAKIAGKINLLKIGNGSSLGDCHIAIFAPLTIGSRVVINDGVEILSASHDTKSPTWQRIEKPIVIDDYAWVATNAIILPGVNIGKGAVVAAGSVVTKSVPDYSVVAGNPAKVIGTRTQEALRYEPTALLAPFEAWLGPQQKCDTKAEK